MDGSVGLPGYSGLFPNTMLAHSLVLFRDVQLSGSATDGLTQIEQRISAFPTNNESAVKRLQPNIRAVLAEMELFEGLKFVNAVPAKLTLDGNDLFILERPAFSDFVEQTKRVLSYADLRGERVNEILSQVVPQTAYWSAIAGLTPERHRYTLELLGVGLRFTMQIVMKFKHAMQVPRPMEISALVQPMILTPGYTAYPSGHATEASFAAEFLSLLAESSTSQDRGQKASRHGLRMQLHRLAYRVAENRVVAGLHYPIDSMAGFALGITLAGYVARRCGASAPLGGRSFAVPSNAATAEPVLDRLLDGATDISSKTTPQATQTLIQLWTWALGEVGA